MTDGRYLHPEWVLPVTSHRKQLVFIPCLSSVFLNQVNLWKPVSYWMFSVKWFIIRIMSDSLCSIYYASFLPSADLYYYSFPAPITALVSENGRQDNRNHPVLSGWTLTSVQRSFSAALRAAAAPTPGSSPNTDSEASMSHWPAGWADIIQSSLIIKQYKTEDAFNIKGLLFQLTWWRRLIQCNIIGVQVTC